MTIKNVFTLIYFRVESQKPQQFFIVKIFKLIPIQASSTKLTRLNMSVAFFHLRILFQEENENFQGDFFVPKDDKKGIFQIFLYHPMIQNVTIFCRLSVSVFLDPICHF
jgi:hypothetical protein